MQQRNKFYNGGAAQKTMKRISSDPLTKGIRKDIDIQMDEENTVGFCDWCAANIGISKNNVMPRFIKGDFQLHEIDAVLQKTKGVFTKSAIEKRWGIKF